MKESEKEDYTDCKICCTLWKTYTKKAQPYKLHESGNGTKISDEKWCSAKTKYLENKKR